MSQPFEDIGVANSSGMNTCKKHEHSSENTLLDLPLESILARGFPASRLE
jgi:hypothetical protein